MARSRIAEALHNAKFPMASLVVRGQGFQDGAEDVRRFRKACLSGRCKPVKSLLVRSAMAEARTISDPAGNEKLAKSTQGGRRLRAKDDIVSAGILAVAEGERQRTAKPAEGPDIRIVRAI